MQDDSRTYTITAVANRLGVSRATVHEWIRDGLLKRPPFEPSTAIRAYTSDSMDRIERWYLNRAASGGTRGPGAKARRDHARQKLLQLQTLPADPVGPDTQEAA